MTPEDIKGIREALGITQDEMAVILGLTKTSISRYELGQGKPTENTEKKLVYLKEALNNPEQRTMLQNLCRRKEYGAASMAAILAFIAALPIMPLPLMGLTLFSVLKAPIGRAFADVIASFTDSALDRLKEPAQALSSAAASLADSAKEKAAQLKEPAGRAAAEVGETMAGLGDAAREKVSQLKEPASQLLADVAGRIAEKTGRRDKAADKSGDKSDRE
ncbi:MAG: helix-turn-helix domain-containing protein [Desulfovibrionaceae bacterium]|nr:helix-turn-helix domain-containing protein [Desulfovibrionaceae bacterium]